MDATATTITFGPKVQWMCMLYTDHWSVYDDIENMIIEEAYQANDTHAMLDGRHVDFSLMVQIKGPDIDQQSPVKRVTNTLEDHLDYDRKWKVSQIFNSNPSDINRPGVFGDFIWQAYLLGQWRDVPQQILVERAAQGIIEEGDVIEKGNYIGCQIVSKKLAELLLEVKHGTRKQIWYRCVYLYTLSSFLSKRLNETLLWRMSEGYEKECRRNLRTLGLFAWFLFDFPQDANEFEGYVYRGLGMLPEFIDSYQNAAKTGESFAFPSFTSTSRNRSVAENFGRHLLILSIVRSRETSVDVSAISRYPQEEEQLLIPGFLFKVERVECDTARGGYNIYLQDCNNQEQI